MDKLSELRRLAMVEAYLTDLVCDVKNPRHADILMEALLRVQQALVQMEGKYASQGKIINQGILEDGKAPLKL